MSNKCPVCGGELVREVQTANYTYKGVSTEVDQPGDWCNQCGEGVLTQSDMKSNRKVLHDFRAIVDNYLPSYEIQRIRKKLHLRQRDAGEIFGGGPNAFSRYERGETMQPRSLDQLFRLLDKYPEQKDDLLIPGVAA